MQNANNILFRASGVSNIMTDGNSLTEKQAKTIEELTEKLNASKITDNQKKELERLINKRDNPELSKGVITHLVDLFVSEVHHRKEEAKGKMLEKGNEREEDSITLYSRVKKRFFNKNEEHLKNQFIKGTPDLYIGESIHKSEETIDTKTSWSAHTFFRSKYKELDDDYYYQGMAYMALTGAKKHTVAFCLVNGTFDHITNEKRKLSYSYIDPDNSQDYKYKCRQIEINHIFDRKAFDEENPGFEWHTEASEWSFDIPMEKRLHTVQFDRDEAVIKKMYKRVTECRNWMNENLFK